MTIDFSEKNYITISQSTGTTVLHKGQIVKHSFFTTEQPKGANNLFCIIKAADEEIKIRVSDITGTSYTEATLDAAIKAWADLP